MPLLQRTKRRGGIFPGNHRSTPSQDGRFHLTRPRLCAPMPSFSAWRNLLDKAVVVEARRTISQFSNKGQSMSARALAAEWPGRARVLQVEEDEPWQLTR